MGPSLTKLRKTAGHGISSVAQTACPADPPKADTRTAPTRSWPGLHVRVVVKGGRLRGERLHEASAERSSSWAIDEARGHCSLHHHVFLNHQHPANVPRAPRPLARTRPVPCHSTAAARNPQWSGSPPQCGGSPRRSRGSAQPGRSRSPALRICSDEFHQGAGRSACAGVRTCSGGGALSDGPGLRASATCVPA